MPGLALDPVTGGKIGGDRFAILAGAEIGQAQGRDRP